MPFLFNDDAICSLVFLPDVPDDTKAIVYMRIDSPIYDIDNPIIRSIFIVLELRGVISE